MKHQAYLHQLVFHKTLLNTVTVPVVKEELAHKEAEIELQLREVEYWQAYQSQGHTTQSTQIALLDAELADMDQSFIEMKGQLNFSRSFTDLVFLI